MSHRVAIDIGGTFTDLVLEHAEGYLATTKVLSTPPNLVSGVLEALHRSQVPVEELEVFVHGTTQGINAVLERRGARVALITTAGFRDTYLLGRGNRPDMYNLHFRKAAPLLDRASTFEVVERLSATGEVLTPVDRKSVESVVAAVGEGGYDVIALCLLHSYANAEHELQVERLFHDLLPGMPVVSSHRVAPEWREYERTSTTVMSAYITPIMSAYLEQLEASLRAAGLGVPVYINESNGGVMTAGLAVDHAVGTLLSGPVGGVIGTAALSAVVGEANLISADVGGTSFDVSIVSDGKPSLYGEFEMQGLPVLAPSVEVHTIGAGGGSLITVDSSGRLKVGPQSAGAVPGPACYGMGGTIPSITDAHVVLGRLPANQRLAGDLELDVEAARTVMREVGAELELGDVDLAAQALEIVNFRMAEAIRELTTERGLDPRGFTLCFFGGAGGLHAVDVAEELEIRRVIVPVLPGSFSASGMLRGGIQHDLVQSFFRSRSQAAIELAAAVAALGERAEDLLEKESVDPSEAFYEYFVDMRYVGQEYSMRVPYEPGQALDALSDSFHAAYLERYSHASEDSAIEFVALRVTAGSRFQTSVTMSRDLVEQRPEMSERDEQVVFFDGQPIRTRVLRRSNAVDLQGPALLLEDTCTTVVPPGWTASTIAGGHLLLERNADR